MKKHLLFCLAAMVAAHTAIAADPPPVKIAVLEDMSGVYSAITGPGSVTAAQLAIEDFGATVLGRKIELVSADHLNRADVGAEKARRWLDVEGVDMITGLGNSSVAMAVREYARSKQKIDIVTSGGLNDLTGKACSPTGFHWVYNTYALAKAVATATVKAGNKSIYFVAADYAFGNALARDGAQFTIEAGGKVLGTVRSPLNTPDFSSFILQAQASGAQNIGLALAGQDVVTFVKQAAEFGVVASGQNISTLIAFVNDVHALGLKAAQGLYLAEAFYWDLSDETRAFSKRFYAKRQAMPNGMQAGVYSAVFHYLKAVKAAGTTDSVAVAAKMRELPVEDFFGKDVTIRRDGRVIRDIHLFQVKKPDQSTGEWDVMTRVETVKGVDAFQPLSNECAFIAQAK